MSKNSAYAALIAGLMLGTPAVDAEDPPRVPGLAVGIMHFERSEGVPICAIETIIRKKLDMFGIKSVDLPPDATVDVAFEDPKLPRLDVIVSGSLVFGTSLKAIAKVYVRGASAPKADEGVCEDVVAFVTRSVTDVGAVARVLRSREALAEKTLKDKPQDFDSLMTLGLSESQKGNWQEAQDYLERAATVKPDDVDALLNLALCYKQRNDREHWLQYLTRAESQDGDHAGVFIAMGNYYAQFGERARAIEYYEKARGTGLCSDVAIWNLAVVYAELRDFDRAIANLAALADIPHSSFKVYAGEWKKTLEAEKQCDEQEKRAAQAPRKSLNALLGFPDSVAVLLVGVALTLCLIPYFGGKRILNLDIPEAPRRLSRTLMFIGPVFVLAVLAMFPPLFPPPAFQRAQFSAAPAAMELNPDQASTKYLRAKATAD